MKKNTLYGFTMCVDGANPNGDPDNDNRPRSDQNGNGLMSRYCLKHKIRRQMHLHGIPVLISNDVIGKDSNVTTYFKDMLAKDGVDCKNKTAVRDYIIKSFRDIPMFGHAATLMLDKKSRLFDESITGAFSVDDACSLNELTIVDYSGTKCVCSVENDADKGKDTMGATHHVVKDAIYFGTAGINYNMFDKNGCSETDEKSFENALVTMFDNDVSAARPIGSMGVIECVKLYDDGSVDSKISELVLKRELKKSIKEDGTFDREKVMNIAKIAGRSVEFLRETVK